MKKRKHISLSAKRANFIRDKKKYGYLLIKDVEFHPWKMLCVDLIGPYTVCTKKGVQSLHAMSMFDPATLWFEVVEIPIKKAITCANILENNWLCCYL